MPRASAPGPGALLGKWFCSPAAGEHGRRGASGARCARSRLVPASRGGRADVPAACSPAALASPISFQQHLAGGGGAGLGWGSALLGIGLPKRRERRGGKLLRPGFVGRWGAMGRRERAELRYHLDFLLLLFPASSQSSVLIANCYHESASSIATADNAPPAPGPGCSRSPLPDKLSRQLQMKTQTRALRDLSR